jgi:hypothetical protein
MLKSRRLSPAFCAALLAILLGCATSQAAPITVNLRVEGSTKTLYEGPVSTEAIPASPGLTTKSSEGAHPCDVKDNGVNEGFGVEAATPTAALHSAATASSLTFDAKWSKGLNDFFVTQVGSDVNGGAPEFPSWGYAVNYTTAGVGGCQFQLAAGSEVLWAYNYFNLPHLLKLTGPASASTGSSFSVHVADAQTGEPISGASIGEVAAGVTTPLASGATTDAGGNASISLASVGSVTLKATRKDAVRSNGLSVCLHNGNDGSCGTTVPGVVPQPPVQKPLAPEGDVAKLAGIRSGHVYRRRFAPRVLSGIVEIRTGGTLRDVRISLARRYRGHCSEFSGSKARFVRVRRCGGKRFFSVGGAQSFSYLLPAPLPPGGYVLEMQAIESNGQVTKLVDGISHVSFRVG